MLSGVSFFNNAANFRDFNRKNKLIGINYNWNNCSKTVTPSIIEKNQENEINFSVYPKYLINIFGYSFLFFSYNLRDLYKT